MTVLIAVETVVLIVLAVLVAGLLRAYATVLQRLHALDGGGTVTPPPFRTAAGVPAPPSGSGPAATAAASGSGDAAGRQEWPPASDISGEGLTGEIVSVRTVAVEHDTVLVFLSSGCAGCTVFWEQLADRHGPFAGSDGLWSGSRVLVVTKDPHDESVGLLQQLSPPGVDVVMSTPAWDDFGVPGSPYVIVVDGPSGRVKGEGSGTSLDQISGLMQQAYGDGAGGPGSRRVRKPLSDMEREVDVDRALLAVGIGPGHPSLYGTTDEDAASDPDLPIDMSRVPAERRLPTVPAWADGAAPLYGPGARG